MKKVILTIAVGLMTMVGFGQNFEYINVGTIHRQDIQTLEVMNTLFKPDSLKSKCDSTLIKKFFKNKFRKKFTVVNLMVEPDLSKKKILTHLDLGDYKNSDIYYTSLLSNNYHYVYNKKLNVYADKEFIRISMESNEVVYSFVVNLKKKTIENSYINVISVD